MKSNSELTIENIGKFLEKLSPNSEDVYWLSSPDFSKIIFISPAYEKIWQRPRELLYSNPHKWGEYLDRDEHQDYDPIAQMAIRIKEQGVDAKFHETYAIKLPNGEQKWIFDRGFPIFIDGECCGVTGVASDITKEKQKEILLYDAKQQAELANIAKTEFIANMSHDLRTPLSIIIGTSNILAEKILNPEHQELINAIAVAGKCLQHTFEDILSYSCIESGQINLQEDNFDLYALIDDTLTLFKDDAAAKNIELISEMPVKESHKFFGDSKLLSRVLSNLLHNALKFTEQGFVKVKLSLVKRSIKDFECTLQIIDSGIGIPEDQLQVIFDRFSRVAPGYNGEYNGTGLGLTIVKKFVDLMSGEVTVTSELNKGSCFSCVIPLKREHAEKQKDGEYNAANGRFNLCSTLSRQVRDEHFLLVEDHPMAQRITTLMLEEYTSNIDIAESASDAMQLLATNPYSLIFMDIGLPDKSGFELSKIIRESDSQNKDTPIIAVTAHMTSQEKEICIESGMNGFYQKPLSSMDLKKILETHLCKYKTHTA